MPWCTCPRYRQLHSLDVCGADTCGIARLDFGDTLLALIVQKLDSFTNVAIVPCARHAASDLQLFGASLRLFAARDTDRTYRDSGIWCQYTTAYRWLITQINYSAGSSAYVPKSGGMLNE